MAASDLHIKLDRPDVGAAEFAAAIQAMVGLVKAVGDTLTEGRGGAVRWVIQDLRGGSAFLEATPELLDDSISDAQVVEMLTAAGNGLKLLDTTAERPPHFSDAALREAKRLAEILNEADIGVSTARFGSIAIQPSKRIAGNVDELISGRQKSIGTIEGRLVTLTTRGDRPIFFVEDRARKLRVQCNFGEEIFDRVVHAFNRRVSVRGTIWSRPDGVPQLIDVAHFELLQEDADLPSARDVRGILRDLMRHVQ